MQLIGGKPVYSATDLVGFLECRHLAHLERAVAHGLLKRPQRKDPVLDRIAQRGRDHEDRFRQGLTAQGLDVVAIAPGDEPPRPDRIEDGTARTVAAMRAGADVLYQAVLFDGRRLGYADFLRRVEQPSRLGSWSYEVWDTKLARHAKASAVLQLCLYSDLVAAVQGRSPEWMHVALGGVQQETASFRVADYAAYYRSVARGFDTLLGSDGPHLPVPTEPEPVEHCDVCRWSIECRRQWRAADDLSLVANLSSRQRRALRGVGVATRTGLAEPPTPLPDRLEGAGRDALARLRVQAAIQVRGERQGQVIAERVPPPADREGRLLPNHGLLMLPPPSPGDLFFDMEGDPFFGSSDADGIDYLFGVIEPGHPDPLGQPTFHALWAIEDSTVIAGAERKAFEAVIDLIVDRMHADPDLHVYHYAPYEPTAMKRLAGRHGTRESEVDQLLRGNVFVDLYRAVRQGIRAAVESYSIKRLEPLYGFTRSVDLRDAGTSIVEFETWLELGQREKRSELLAQIEGYNRDDCLSTLYLRDWLEGQRAALERDLGAPLPRPAALELQETGDSPAQQEVRRLAEQLTADAPEGLEGATSEQRGRWLLAQLLNWHRREDRSFWWRYFFLKDELTDDERQEQPDALGNLAFETSWADPTPKARSTTYRFRFPPQDHKIGIGDQPHDPVTGKAAGTVFHVDGEEGIIDLRVGSTRPAPRPTSLIPHDLVRSAPKPESLQRLAQWVIDQGIDAPGDRRAARDLLLRKVPRTGQSRADRSASMVNLLKPPHGVSSGRWSRATWRFRDRRAQGRAPSVPS